MTDDTRAKLKALADDAYCDYITKLRSTPCLGWEAKVRAGTFGETELNAHVSAGELYGMHLAFHKAIALLDAERARCAAIARKHGAENVAADVERC